MSGVRAATEVAKVTKAMRRPPTRVELYAVAKKAPLTGRGIVTFVLLHGGWVCDECLERVTVSQFESHIKKEAH